MTMRAGPTAWVSEQHQAESHSDNWLKPGHKRRISRRSPYDDHIADTSLVSIISLVAGIAILMMPRLLNYIVAAYLILIGVLGLEYAA